MNQTIKSLLLTASFALIACAAGAADAITAPANTWHAQTLGEALLYTALFGLAGTVLAIAGYKLFDKCTPGDLHKEIIENKNVAAALVSAAVILGVCIIIAAAMVA